MYISKNYLDILPAELYKKVFSYINPIKEYIKYIKALEEREKLRLELNPRNRTLHQHTMGNQDIIENIYTLRHITGIFDRRMIYSNLSWKSTAKKVFDWCERSEMNEELIIRPFLLNNPLFKRPHRIYMNDRFKYRTSWDFKIDMKYVANRHLLRDSFLHIIIHLKDYKVKELKKMCQENGIKSLSRLKKKELIQALIKV